MRVSSEEIVRELDIVAWIEDQGLDFKLSQGSSGPQVHLQECPWCGDRRWRLDLNQETGLGKCFVCDEGVNKLKLIKAVMGFQDDEWAKVFTEAKRSLRDQGWQAPKMQPVAVDVSEVKLPNSFALPTEEGQNLVYLEQRGISGDIAGFFGLRMCIMGKWHYTKIDGSIVSQRFDSRVLIPVFDLDGTLKTFQGRDVTGTSDKKYLFPATLPGTGRYLLNGQNVVKTKRLAVGEGAFDIMAMKIAFDEDVIMRDIAVVGSFGKHLSYGSLNGDDQLARFLVLKRQGLEEVTIMWDGEAKALVAALNAAKLLKGIGLQVRIATMPADKDPNEVLPSVVREAFNQAQHYTSRLDLLWRLKNPYAARKTSVIAD